MGMNDKQLHQCCDHFYQVDDPMHHSRIGSGLGLSLCKKIVQALQGIISIESKLGQGSKVHVTLPLKLENTAKIHITA
jgi:signal transduction histidine kinase